MWVTYASRLGLRSIRKEIPNPKTMLFNSLNFPYFFLPITYFIFWKLTSKKQRYIWLTVSGYVFYSFWNYKFCLLMALSTTVSYLAGLGFLRWKALRARQLCVILPVVIDLTLLGFFKYANFALSSIGDLLNKWAIPISVPYFSILLPIGISFYTFHTITYIVDSYRGTIVPTRNFFEFACYVSFFPQLVAGPIVRFRQVEGDLDKIDHPDLSDALERGMSFFVLGMIKKVLIADSIAKIVNPLLMQWPNLSTATAWLCALGYTYQLYFDFSGYSDMAVGLALFFGIHLPQNFNSPYKALDPSDFWRRWHISLSTILRDYLYIPLGGGREGEWPTCRNLMITMLLGGLWHGADWKFVAWGGYHGLLLIVSRYGFRRIVFVPSWLRRMVTFVLVVIGWVLFRATSFTMATGWLRKLFVWNSAPGNMGAWTLVLPILIAGSLAHFCPNSFELSHRWNWASALALTALFAACLVTIYGGKASPFLYFQF
jgi:alginate O-acetyltransferase complex protein AlgI